MSVVDNTANPDDKKQHGGQRDNSGQKSENEKSFKAAAESVIAFIETAACASGGEAWRMGKDEKKKLTDALTAIFKNWEVMGLNNPYAAIAIYGACYAFGKDRATIAGAISGAKEIIQSAKIKPKEKAPLPPPINDSGNAQNKKAA